ncbi:MAG TPA: GTP-binding protein [Firmicutes bacterium]|nr:GTP-binding protein [Bacillota bacterium]
MNKLVVGILAHVDAGKTTLSESMLYLSGRIQRMGRVDKQDAYLDTHALEKERGITIFSKQAVFELGKRQVTLLDTPGHVDFSAEMERVLHILDYAILVISGADGVQVHTKTLWRLLQLHKIPVFIFVNKMDQPGAEPALLQASLEAELSSRCTSFNYESRQDFLEELALRDEKLTDAYLATGSISGQQIKNAILERRLFPCFYGSALKSFGVAEFLRGLAQYTVSPTYPAQFGAEIFKVSRDEQGNRLAHMKIVGGSLTVRDELKGPAWQDKVTQIRVYSGNKFETVPQVDAGSVCAVTGLAKARPGQGLGVGTGFGPPVLEPLLSYRVITPKGYDPQEILPKLNEIEEEQPELNVVWQKELQEIQVQIMGEVQLEIIQSMMLKRFGVKLSFDEGRILYKETITKTVEGVGHFEPHGHYAEVHLLLTPGKRGSGLKFSKNLSEDILAVNWQNQIISNLKERTHKGVLTGAPITDIEITLVGGRAHKSHTRGGDFREAAFRALRQGLKQAGSILLEPYYNFRLEVPEDAIGRAMTDVANMEGECQIAGPSGELAVLKGSAPAANMRNYQQEVRAYTKGLGRLFSDFAGYRPCRNAEKIIGEIGYDSEKDLENPTGSIFFAQGSGFFVPWDEVKEHMHIPAYLDEKEEVSPAPAPIQRRFHEPEEIDYDLLARTVSANRGKKRSWKKHKSKTEAEKIEENKEAKEEYLLVDGYNIIHAWPELKAYARESIDVARLKLLDALASYKGVSSGTIIVVFA